MAETENGFDELDLIAISAAAELCGIAEDTLGLWGSQGKLPAYSGSDGQAQVRLSELIDFMREKGIDLPSVLPAQACNAGDNIRDDGGDEVGSVLVVDDDAMVRTMIVQVLDGLYPVCTAETGFEALHCITMHKQVKVILLDIRMPGQSGVDTYNEIKRLRPDVSVIVVSGYIEDVPDEMMADTNVAGIIEKPVDEDTLVDMVASAMVMSEMSEYA